MYIWREYSGRDTLNARVGDRRSGGDSASYQKSGGKGRQLATSALKNHDKIHVTRTTCPLHLHNV